MPSAQFQCSEPSGIGSTFASLAGLALRLMMRCFGAGFFGVAAAEDAGCASAVAPGAALPLTFFATTRRVRRPLQAQLCTACRILWMPLASAVCGSVSSVVVLKICFQS